MSGRMQVLLLALLGVPALITLWAMADGDGRGGPAEGIRQRLARVVLVVVSLAAFFAVFIGILALAGDNSG